MNRPPRDLQHSGTKRTNLPLNVHSWTPIASGLSKFGVHTTAITCAETDAPRFWCCATFKSSAFSQPVLVRNGHFETGMKRTKLKSFFSTPAKKEKTHPKQQPATTTKFTITYTRNFLQWCAFLATATAAT